MFILFFESVYEFIEREGGRRVSEMKTQHRQKMQMQQLVNAENKKKHLKMNDRDGMLLSLSLQSIKCIQNDANITISVIAINIQ